MFEKIASKLQGCSPKVCKSIIELAVEIAREGREGRRIGMLFTVARSRPFSAVDIGPDLRVTRSGVAVFGLTIYGERSRNWLNWTVLSYLMKPV